MADALNELLHQPETTSLDIASAFFAVSGFRLLREALQGLFSFRLLLGSSPDAAPDLGLHSHPERVADALRGELEMASLSPQMMDLVEDLIRFLRRDEVQVRTYTRGFLHAKCYLFYEDPPKGQPLRLCPIAGIVGSGNFTGPGLTTNRELNLAHLARVPENALSDEVRKIRAMQQGGAFTQDVDATVRTGLRNEVGIAAITELDRWFTRHWEDAQDFKERLIEILDESKFGAREYTPWEVYLKTLFEYFRDDLADSDLDQYGKSAVELTEFQEDAVKKARKILARYDGVMIADAVGLGKTWIGKKLLEDYAYHQRQKALVVCPASLRQMWDTELTEASIAAQYVTQESLGQSGFDTADVGDVDVILVDESHNFRNHATQRFENLERVIALNGGRGRDGSRKKIILLTATPINNDLMDLYNQISLMTQGDQGYFAAAGIGNLRRYFLSARKDGQNGGSSQLFNLLEEVVIRRPRHFIQQTYPDATINGKPVKFPKRKLHTVRYDLESSYEGIYEAVVSGIESLHLAPYDLESYKKRKGDIDTWEQGRGQALVHIFKCLYLKRFESSVHACRRSLHWALAFHKTFFSLLLDGKVVASRDFRKLTQILQREGEEDDATPKSLTENIDESEEALTLLETLEQVNPDEYDLKRLNDAIQHDIDVLTDLWNRIRVITAKQDAKLTRLKRLLTGDLKGQKVLLFSYFKDTAKYVREQLQNDARFIASAGNPNIRLMDSDVDTPDRKSVVQSFSPKHNGKPEWAGTDREIDILVSTDVLSEGQNLQDCGYLVNYDLHWNPTRMVQRAGRIDRIGTEFETLHIYNMFPEEGLDRLLRLVESLERKLAYIDSQGMLDASVLGEKVNPRAFNALKRIQDEDSSIIDEEERAMELASNEYMLQMLAQVLKNIGRETLESLPDGIHSGLIKPNANGIFFYFQATRRDGRWLTVEEAYSERNGAAQGQNDATTSSAAYHFWRYYDIRTRTISDNRFEIANLIACDADTPRVIPDFDWRTAMDLVMQDVSESQADREALEVAPRTVDPLQATVSTALLGAVNRAGVNRSQVLGLLQFLKQPMSRVQVKELRQAYEGYQTTGDVAALIASCSAMRDAYGVEPEQQKRTGFAPLGPEHLRLVCFDMVSG